MTNFPASESDNDVPPASSLTHIPVVSEIEGGLTDEEWERVESLFDQMLESTEPEAVLARERIQPVARTALRLFESHIKAKRSRFLAEPIALVQRMRRGEDVSQPRFSPGEILAGRFTVETLLGAGGMGEVYSAHDARLNERVAVKTIRSALANDPAVHRRFVAEVQAARRVTHPNVCRIFDLSEHGEIPFFAMEYLKGPGLAEWLQARYPLALRRRIALQLAEGLAAAHAKGILHCDFKPANIILTGTADNPVPIITDFGLARAFSASGYANVHSLQAGTLEYMAPELLRGSPASVGSDIYAFGKVALQLLPGYSAASTWAADRQEDRPAALDEVIARLRGNSRRVWLLAAAVSFGGLAGYEILTRPQLALTSRERLAFNLFRPADSETASLLRNLLIIGLRQSLLLNIVTDDRLRSVVGKLPAGHAQLLSAAEREGIAFVAEGTMTGANTASRFLLQIFRPDESRPALTISESASNGALAVSMAERIARKLRREFGESAAALQSGYVPLDRITSASAEAAAFYFHGLALYETAEAEAAIDWFDQAIRIDSQFALAHLSRGIALAARYQWFTALPSYQRAFELRSRVGDRERLWIETSYYNIMGDFEKSLSACRRLATLYPEEAIFQRNTAFAYAATGRPSDALPFSRRALELDPTGVSNASELIVNHAEANQYDEALRLHDEFRRNGITNTLLEWGAGLAWMGKGEFEKARASFDQMGSDAKRDRWARLLRCAPDILQGRFSAAATKLESDLVWDVEMNEQGHLVDRRIWLGNIELLMDLPEGAKAQSAELNRLGASPTLIEACRQSAMIAIAAQDDALALQAHANLEEIARKWPSSHTDGVVAHVGALLTKEESRRAELFSQAAGLWADPPLLLSRARWYRANRNLTAALADCEEIDRQTGRILKRYFPGLLVLAWIEKAECLKSLSRIDDALRLYIRIGKYWQADARSFTIMRKLTGAVRQ